MNFSIKESSLHAASTIVDLPEHSHANFMKFPIRLNTWFLQETISFDAGFSQRDVRIKSLICWRILLKLEQGL